MQEARFLQVLPRSTFKRLVLSTTLWQHAKMSTTLKSPEGLKDFECKKGQLSSWPPVPYIPPTDLVTTKEAPVCLKMKLLNGTIFNMSILCQGNTKEYLAHIVPVLCLIKQKGLAVQCRKLAKAVDKLAGTLENLLKAAGSKTSTVFSNDDVEARKFEIEQTQQMIQGAQKAHNEAIAKRYKLLRNFLSSDPQSQWDRICREMHKRDSWVGVNGKVTKGRHPCMWAAFQDCLELHELTVFTADAAKRQRFYIQQAVRKPLRATVRQHISCMGELNDYDRHLPTLKNSPTVVPATKKGNIPIGEVDLATIIMETVLMMWQNQYNLTHTTVPKSMRALLLDLEAIEQVMVEKKQQDKLKAKGKAAAARPEAKSNPKQKTSGGPTG
jgi:hypothetical protein